MMNSRVVRRSILLLGILVLTHSAHAVRRSAASKSFDICCAGSNDCPNGLGCQTSVEKCSDEWEGFCVPIPSP